jgi:hypothetical protein
MFFPIVAPIETHGPWCYVLYQEALMQMWAFLGQWFLRKKFNDPTLYLHFYNYLPFGEDLVLYLYKLEIPFYVRMICIKFDWNWPASSGDFF